MKLGTAVQAEGARQAGLMTTRRTGELEDNIILRTLETPAGLAVEIVAEAPYSLFVHEGQQPHTISARNAPKLVFLWERSGQIESFSSVEHPGAKPRPFLTTALKQVIRA